MSTRVAPQSSPVAAEMYVFKPNESTIDQANSSTQEECNTEYEVIFHFDQFLIALAMHVAHFLLGPVSILVMRLIVGRHLCTNLGFGFTRLYRFELLAHLLFAITVFVSVWQPTRTNDFRFVIVASMTIVLLRLLMVSLKYGTFQAKWWRLLCSKTLSLQEIVKTLILRAWKEVPTDVAMEEIYMAFSRLPLDYKDLHLIFRDNIPGDIKERLDTMQQEVIGEFSCPIDVPPERYEACYFVARILVEDMVKQKGQICPKPVLPLSVVFCVVPHLLRMYSFGFKSFQFDIIEMLLTPLTTYMNFYLLNGMLKFIVVGVFDFERKKLLMSQCSALISSYDQIYLLEKFPRLDMSDPRSVLGWYYLRRAFLDFGTRFALRVHLYASVIIPILICSVVFLVLQMVKVIGNSYNLELIPPLFLTIAFDYVIVRMILVAMELNESFQVHSDLLQESVSLLKDKDAEAVSVIMWAIRKLEVDLILRPVKILGVTIDDGMVNKLVALGISGGFALVQNLTS